MSVTEDIISFIIPATTVKRKRSLGHMLKKAWGLKQTIDNVYNVVKMRHEIVVVCNAMNNNLIEYVKSEKKVNKYCINNTNVGVSRAWNMGAMLAEGEFLCFINDDVELGTGDVEELIRVLESDDSIGEVGPAGGKFITDLGEPGPRVGTDRVEEADEISGFMFIIKAHIFKLTGGFDVSYTPASYEEVDMSYKIRSLRFSCRVVPNLHIIHHNYDGISTKKNATIEYFDKTITTDALNKRNKQLFIEKWKGKYF